MLIYDEWYGMQLYLDNLTHETFGKYFYRSNDVYNVTQ